jgi:PHD/YefM family antitoxin component YafN of YafNO toxin-antitoxin module
MSTTGLVSSIVPISRFNKGGASKIFEEVSKTGVKVVLKNDVPTCVLVTPERYDEMLETIEDFVLFFEAEKRMKNAETAGLVSDEEMMNHFGITEADLENVEVDID